MKKAIYICIPLLVSLLLFSCGTTDGNGEPGFGDGNGFTTFTLSALASPAEAGTVTPSYGSYEKDRNVSVTATAREGWDFVNWTGDQESTDNPLQFQIASNTTLTANFADRRSSYSVDLTVADAEDEISLVFGQNEDEDFVYAPPPPPTGSLDARFTESAEDYYTLFQSNLLSNASWEMIFQSGSGDVLTLTWQITDTQMEGSLILSDSDDPAQSNQLEIDMRSDSEVQINVNEIERVFIHYTLD